VSGHRRGRDPLERRKRAERALTSVVATCYLLGVSTRRMDTLLASLGITTLSKSQVSEMAKELDSHVEEFRTRSLTDAGPFTFVAADALVLKGLAADLVQQPQRTPQPRDPTPHQRRRHLPRPQLDHPARRRGPRRTARRMGRRPPLPRTRRPRPRPSRQHQHSRGGDRRPDPATSPDVTDTYRGGLAEPDAVRCLPCLDTH